MFTNAKNPVINGGAFTMQGDFHSHHVVNDGMELLQQYIAPGAFHNSDERHDPPKCHPHTRKAVLKKIMDWVKDANKVALILWLYGPAGAGKSAIAQTIAELLEEAGLLAGAFFFSRNGVGRDDKIPFVATLVYQLIISIPEIRAHVLGALERDPALFSRSIQTQIQALIIKPLNTISSDETLATTLLFRPRLIILDGLDECRTTSAQTQILNAISTVVKRLHIPLCFLIASRPEHDIRQAFNDQKSLGSLSFTIALDDTYQPDDDIWVFLKSTFDEIKRKHPSKAHFPASWPSLEDIQRLVRKSSGQFIFASTVAKYVNSRRHWPPDRLKIIFGQSKPGQETPFAELDSVYHLILSSIADTEKLQDFLAFLVLRPFSRPSPPPRQTTSFIEKFLFERPGEIDMILADLHSIIYVPLPGDEFGELRFFHASLPDFLLDRSRSKDLFLDEGTAYAKLTGLVGKHIDNPFPWNDQGCVHHAFRWCCVNARPSPKLLEDLCGLNLGFHMNYFPTQFGVTTPELMCWFGKQRLSPDRAETLLDHHLATFDKWLREEYRALSGSHYLTVVTLLDQLDPKEYNWERVSVILQQGRLLDMSRHGWLLDLFGGTKENIQYSRILSKFVIDGARAGLLWVNFQTYVRLATCILEILRDKRFIDIFNVHTVIPTATMDTTYYDVGKLAFHLLPILLSRIKALGGSQVHEVTVLLRSHPAFYLVKNDPLEFEKVKAVQAMEEF